MSQEGDHRIWTDRLSDHLDGHLAADESREVEGHLEGCPACRATLTDLARVREAARGLPDLPPRRDLWPAIREGLGQADVHPIEPARRSSEEPRRGLYLTVPQLAAAAVALLLLGGAGTWSLTAGIGGPSGAADEGVPTAAVDAAPAGEAALEATSTVAVEPEAGYAAEVARLEGVLAESRERLEPGTVRVLERNLQAVDRAIRDSRQALEADPGNAWVRDHLRRAWERKLTYLRDAADIVAWSAADT